MAATTASTGATAWWNAGYTGAGVDIAVIDTGVSPVEGLDGAGKIINGPDLSLESQNPAFRYLDTSGHGTFIAGLIAANSPAYKGIAPDARIVSLKVGVADGGVDVSQVIAAIDWVIEHKTDNGLNIRVINLSYGTNSLQDSAVDPLSYAVEQAWKKGIVVVAAAGNTGYQRGVDAPGLASPANNRFVLAVGGYDTMGTVGLSDDAPGSYSASSSERTDRKPDVLAVGSHLLGLRVPNSFLDGKHPEAVRGTRYLRGSGTSQAVAIASGSIALLLQKYPSMPPDQVKRWLRTQARQLTTTVVNVQGKGAIDLARMAAGTPSTSYTQTHSPATGTGTLDGARGTDRLTDDGVAISGEKDIFGRTFDSSAIAAATAAGSSWSGGTWNGSSWSGSSWSGSSWSGSSWSGSSWSGSSWSGSSWSGNSWSGSSWSGSSWSGSSWSGSSWSGNSWSTGSWD
jgi:serine protease AprX